MSVRNLVYELLKNDAQLTAMGYGAGALFTNFTMDSPAARLEKWLTIRWGVADAPVGRDAQARPVNMSLWAYNRQKDYGPIQQALYRARQVLLPVVGMPQPGGGHMVACDWSGTSEDLWDDVYEAIMRGENYRVVTTLL